LFTVCQLYRFSIFASLCLSAVPERSIPLSSSFFTLIPSAPIYLSFSLPLSLSLSPLLSFLNDRLYKLSCPVAGVLDEPYSQLSPLIEVAIPARQAIGWTQF
jgi:hypothetical protein